MPEKTAETSALAVADLGPGNSATLQPSIAPRSRADRIRGVLDAFLRGRKASTLRAYSADLDTFAAFLNEPSREAAVARLLAQDPGEANAIALTYRNHMVDEGLGSATVNRRLASLRAFVKLARMLGLVTWSIEIESVQHESYTDIFGPGAENIGRMVAKSLELGGAQGVRNAAILRLLYDRGLRRGELVGCDFEHYDSERGISLLGKGKTQRVWYALPEATHEAVQAWIKVRGSAPGPLFIALNDVHCGHRLTGNRIYDIVRELGESIGVRARPHGVRHAAISTALNETNGDVRLVQRFSRHADVRTVLRYDDARRDDAFQAANLVAATIPSTSTRVCAVGYARVSLKRQTLGHGLERQRAGIRTWAIERNIELITVIEEAAHGDRPIEKRDGLREALELVEEHGALFLAVESSDRLARDVNVAEAVYVRLEKAGARIVTTMGLEEDFKDYLRGLVEKYERARDAQKAEQTLAAMCGRGHVHAAGAAAINRFCMDGECALEAGKPLPIRRIAWRSLTYAS